MHKHELELHISHVRKTTGQRSRSRGSKMWRTYLCPVGECCRPVGLTIAPALFIIIMMSDEWWLLLMQGPTRCLYSTSSTANAVSSITTSGIWTTADITSRQNTRSRHWQNWSSFTQVSLPVTQKSSFQASSIYYRLEKSLLDILYSTGQKRFSRVRQ